ncbi:dTDP-4-dehydrorhamnose 3,5-epimerase [Paenibacillus sp. NPDC056579]|uniref:dTDP-4-dehydrorhamnose 3,5-epimerase n=1 Tax=Paenibacillus sp. NPDC056579 TaxID=3345871 RepID=UPI0036C6E9A0
MRFLNTPLEGVIVVEPTVLGDHRGWFVESFSQAKYKEQNIEINFVQDNHSYSALRGTLRGLHFQLAPKAQTKLVRCTRGAIFDVAVDIRQGSPSYGKWYGIELSAENMKQLLIPKGFAHGFMTLKEDVEVQYKVDELYAPEFDRGIIWNDQTIGIEWPINITPVLSAKDGNAPFLKDVDHNFRYGG